MNASRGIGERIRSLRLAEDLTQAQLAKQLGVGPAVVGFWETERSNPPDHRVEALERIFGRGTIRGFRDAGRQREEPLGSKEAEVDNSKRRLLLSVC